MSAAHATSPKSMEKAIFREFPKPFTSLLHENLSSCQHSLLPALLPLGVEHPGDAGRQAQEQGAAVHTSAYFNSHLQAANPRSGRMQ